MNSKSVCTQDKAGSTPVDLKKLYSSHVLENTTLQRQKSDIDSAKQKKLRELINNESAFLRKYEKYTCARGTSSRQRRASVDVGLVRAIELSRPSTSCNVRDEAAVRFKSFARDSINSDCPYSLESWNLLVGSDTNIVDQFKKEILFGKSKTEIHRSSSAKELHETESEDMHSINESRLLKRRTLKPLNVDNSVNDFEENVIDAEIMEIQNRGKTIPKGRRHSVIGVSRNTGLSLGAAMKLPSIESNLRSSDMKKSASLEKLSKASSTEDLRPLKVTNRRRSTNGALASEPSFLSLQSPVPEVNTPESENAIEHKTILVHQRPRPVANAAIFIQGEDRCDAYKSEATDNNNNHLSGLDNLTVSEEPKSARSNNSSSSFLPTLTNNQSTVSQNQRHTESATKRVQFQDDPVSGRSDDEVSPAKSPPRLRRQNTMTTTTLKLLVDSHHGAAKLRYIALLANEMEKEEAAKHTPPNSPEPNPYEELSNCRYLRIQARQDSFVDSC